MENSENQKTKKHRQYYEQPHKKISLDLSYSLYTAIKDRAREMKISMVKLITEALEDILQKTKKYNTVELPLSEVLKNDNKGNNKNEEQFDFESISEEFKK